jgi:hypothetical protein
MARRQIPDLPLARFDRWIHCPCGRRTYATYIVGGRKPFVRIQKHPAVLERLAGMKIQKAVRARLAGKAVLFLPLKEVPDNLR